MSAAGIVAFQPRIIPASEASPPSQIAANIALSCLNRLSALLLFLSGTFFAFGDLQLLRENLNSLTPEASKNVYHDDIDWFRFA